MPYVTPEDQQFIDKHRKTAKGLMGVGWVSIIIGMGLAGCLVTTYRTLMELTQTRFIERANASLEKVDVTTELEQQLVQMLERDNELIAQMLSLVVLAIGAMVVSPILLHGISMVVTGRQQHRWLRIVDSLAGRSGLSG